MPAFKRSISEMTNSNSSSDTTNALTEPSPKHATLRCESSCELATVLLSLKASSAATTNERRIRQRESTAEVSDDEGDGVPRLIVVDHSFQRPTPPRKRARVETSNVYLMPKNSKKQLCIPAGRPLHAPPTLVNFLLR